MAESLTGHHRTFYERHRSLALLMMLILFLLPFLVALSQARLDRWLV